MFNDNNMFENEMEDIFGDDVVITPDDNGLEGNHENHIDNDELDRLLNNDGTLGEGGNEGEGNLLNEILKSKGITDGKIKMLNDEGVEEEVDFYSLNRDEQLQLLNSEVENEEVTNDDNFGLDDSEIDLVNFIRERNLTVDEFLEAYKQEIIAELNQANPVYEIDSYTDQELFVLDLQNRFEMTEEELGAELEKELQNEELFKRKVDKLRAEYKELEDNYKEAEKQQFEAKQQEEFNNFSNNIQKVAQTKNEFHGIQLENKEVNQILHTLLDLDDQGSSKVYKVLQNPEVLYEVAWYLNYGKQAFEMMTNAYEAEISRLKKGDNGQQKPTTKNKPKTVVQRNNNNKPKSIYDL